MLSLFVLTYILNDELEEFTRECLASLKGQGDELIVVDNGSTRETRWLDDWTTKVIRLPQNVGYPKGINAGMKAASGDHVACISNDTRLIKGNLQDMVADGLTFPIVEWGKEGYTHPFYHGGFYVVPNQPWALHDERYECFFSDTDLFLTAKRLGKVFRLEESVTIFHHLWATSKLDSDRTNTYMRDAGQFTEKLLR